MTPEEIKEIRAKFGLTQEGFAREMGVSFATINRWENGRAVPKGLYLKVLREYQAKARRKR